MSQESQKDEPDLSTTAADSVTNAPDSPRTAPASATSTPGVVYLSRIPPYMKPAKIRHVFSQYGSVGRVYLQPEGKPIIRIYFSLCCYSMHMQ